MQYLYILKLTLLLEKFVEDTFKYSVQIMKILYETICIYLYLYSFNLFIKSIRCKLNNTFLNYDYDKYD